MRGLNSPVARGSADLETSEKATGRALLTRLDLNPPAYYYLRYCIASTRRTLMFKCSAFSGNRLIRRSDANDRNR